MKWAEFLTADGVKHLVNVESVVEVHPQPDPGTGTVFMFSGKEDATVDLPYEEVKRQLMAMAQP